MLRLTQPSLFPATMNDDAAMRDGLATIEAEMRQILSGDSIRYECAWNIWREAMSRAVESPDVMHPLWLIWGALTDWVENRPEETDDAESAMLRAANEWLSIDRENPTERKAYLDRWVFEEMGYERDTNKSN